ncbi:MAG: hypothetical protein LUC39_01820 [Clostridiales bacterium]|nr:hypothetical protein [Clostridiales bacterium]
MKKTYEVPVVVLQKFLMNQAVAQCTYTPGTTAGQVTVYCEIGKQTETVYASGCSTTSAKIVPYDGSYYLVWYTYAGDTGSSGKPDDTLTAFLATLVVQAGYYSSTSQVPSGWHYAAIDYDTDTGAIQTNLSY